MTTFIRPVQNQANGNTYVEIRNADGTAASFGYTVTDDANMPATPLFTPVGAEYRATPTTYTDGDATVLQSDYRGYLLTVLGDKIAGEDTDNDWLKVSLATKLQAILSNLENDSILVQSSRRSDAFADVSVNFADTTSLQVIKAAVSGKSIYITDITISVDTAGWYTVQDDATATVIGKRYLPANATWSKMYMTPKKVATGQGLKILGQNAGNVTVDMQGYAI